jgi:hypothetical protein
MPVARRNAEVVSRYFNAVVIDLEIETFVP